MNALERDIRQKLEDITEIILRGDALDYTAYASAVARYQVLKALVDGIDERRRNVESTGETFEDE